MSEDEIYHLIDLLEMDNDRYENNDSSKRLLSDAQKKESIIFNNELIKKLKKEMK